MPDLKEKNDRPKRPHLLTLDNNRKLHMTGVLSMDNYDEKQIIATLSENKIIVDGLGLTVDKLSVEEGIIDISGSVSAVRYAKTAEKGSLFKRLVK